MIRVGIFFGGSSREREISFAGGRTVYDNLDKNLFEAIPIFVDSCGHYILLDWQYLYKGSIRDFYPPMGVLPPSAHAFQVYAESLGERSDWDTIMRQVGKPLKLEELKQHIDFAFLGLHGSFGEDGQVQGLLESLGIPYSGSGIRASSIGMDKAFQKRLMEAAGFATPKLLGIERKDWLAKKHIDYHVLAADLGYPLVVRPSNQGSSIGVSIVESSEELEAAIDAAFFIRRLDLASWAARSEDAKKSFLRDCCDLRSGIGLPLRIEEQAGRYSYIYHPERLWLLLNQAHAQGEESLLLEGLHSEQEVLLESFIKGKEFSCVVVRHPNGSSLALPPTEIRKGKEVFDYRSKYLAGKASKITPMQVEQEQLQAIAKECCRLFEYLKFQVYARIDGFLGEDGEIYLNDPNTTSGMLPSSFFFHQAAEIGLNPSQFLSYIIETSLRERIASSLYLEAYTPLLRKLEQGLRKKQEQEDDRQKVAVILGGYSSERHISVESGRNIYEKLSSSVEYRPIPIFLLQDEQQPEGHSLYALPIELLLKDNADDIAEMIQNYHKHPFVEEQKTLAADIRARFASSDMLDEPQHWSYERLGQELKLAFIALHGRPGEDGQIQKLLVAQNIAFNGSEAPAAALSIDKYATLEHLRQAGFKTAQQAVYTRAAWEQAPEQLLDAIEQNFCYPLIAKPIDDGCSSAVKKIKNREELAAYLLLLFRQDPELQKAAAACLKLQLKEEFPQKEQLLIESLIQADGALHFLEITGGLISYYDSQEQLRYHVFEPSETPAAGEVLSLEEKFLAGEGQNITPARLSGNTGYNREALSQQLRKQLEEVAKIIGITGYARIDAFVRILPQGQAELIVIEVNALPGMTPATCIFHQAALDNYKPFDFIRAILAFGVQRQEKQQLLRSAPFSTNH